MATRFAADVHVPSAIIERASLHDMIYAACPRCSTSIQNAIVDGNAAMAYASITCPSCGAIIRSDTVAYKYRLKLQIIYDDVICSAILFDEPTYSLMGVSADRLRKLLLQHPGLPWVMEELLVGLHVSLTYQPAKNRFHCSHKYNRDLKIRTIRPISPLLMPQPLVAMSLDALTHAHVGQNANDAHCIDQNNGSTTTDG